MSHPFFVGNKHREVTSFTDTVRIYVFDNCSYVKDFVPDYAQKHKVLCRSFAQFEGPKLKRDNDVHPAKHGNFRS